MKKVIKRIILIFIVILIIQFILFLFKTTHEVKYEVHSDKQIFKIVETFKNKVYHFKISMGKIDFTFFTDDNYHKKEKLLDKIEYYKKDNLICIYPVIEGSNVMCSYDDKIVSYNVVSDKVSDFVSYLKKQGYNNDSWETVDSNYKNLGQLKIDTNVISEDTNIYVWNYHGFYSVGKELEILKTFENDTYLNELGVIVDNYYVVADYDQKYDFDKFYVYNLKNNKKKEIELKEEISRDSYVLGVVDGWVYIFDKDELKEYKINPKKRKVVEVGNKDDGGIFYDGVEFKNVSIYDFNKDEELYFLTDTSYLDDVVDKTSLKYVYSNNDVLYYYDKDNNFYLYDSVTGVKVLMFSNDVSNIYMLDNDIYFIMGNGLYQYSENDKVRQILSYDEFSFNSKNRFAVYKK